MAISVVKEDNRFIVKWQEHFGIFTISLLDTPSNRKTILVFLRSLQDSRGKHVFTFQELSALFDSNNRQASSQHMEDFRDCGCDFLQYLTRKRKVDCVVVEAVRQELRHDPLASLKELQERVNARLERKDLTEANMKAAMEQISYVDIRDAVLSQLASGKAHYQESYLLSEMMESGNAIGERAGIQVPENEGMSISDPSSIRSLITPDIPTSSVKDSLKWVVYCMVLYYYGVPLSTLGNWLKVHKTTVLRWMIGLSIELFPIVYRWIYDNVKANIVYIDEKWLKIRGKWHYWFVVLDSDTGLPVLASLLGTRSQWACRWIGMKLKQMGKIPREVITDGLSGYRSMVEDVLEKAKHNLCHFHHQQRVTVWLKKRFHSIEEIAARKPKMKKVFQTEDKRTVRRRLGKLKESSQELGISEWTQRTEANLPRLLPSVGSKRIPRTTNAIERFFRAFNRFYKMRCGFFTVVSAKRELIFFLLMYVFLRQPESGRAPIEAIIPEASRMPLYQLINDPFRTVLGVENVKKNVRMAGSQLQQCIEAQV
jgi:transposase-like protein